MNSRLEWFIAGIKSWITLAPESRPEKIISGILKKILKIDETTFLLRGVKKEFRKREKEYSGYIDNSNYILFIATKHSEKYQTLVLDMFAKLSAHHKNINLLMTGKLHEETKSRIFKDSLFEKRIFIVNSINSSERMKLYRNAYLSTIFPVTREDESMLNDTLSCDTITITSKNREIHHIAEACADYLIYDSFNELYETIVTYLDHQELYYKKREYIIKNFDASLLEKRPNLQVGSNQHSIQAPKKLQFVFISIDIENIKGTIQSIDTYINFVESYLIITSADMLHQFENLSSIYKIQLINENDILDEDISTFKNRDHQTKNWILRASLLKIENLQEQFIMLDDDNRPLKPIGIDHFIQDGKYNAYYYYDLLEWHYYTSDYDFGQQNTRKVLKNDGLELLSYSSHKPQIIDKYIFQEVVDRYDKIGLEEPIDEWSIYFNYAATHYPYLFTKKRFDVLNWPDHPSRWDWLYTPDRYHFENYYAALYMDGLFKDNPNLTADEKIKLKKNELLPYRRTQNLSKALKPYYEKENAVHGTLIFRQDNKYLFCYSLPYYCEAAQGSWLKIPLNYKALSLGDTNSLQLIYVINNNVSHPTNIYTGGDYYFEGIFYFSIDATALQRGLHTLMIDAAIDGERLYGENSPYMMKLKVF